MTTTGGKRAGAGRPRAYDERKAVLSIRLTPSARRFLEAQPESMSETIEGLIRRSQLFSEFGNNPSESGRSFLQTGNR